MRIAQVCPYFHPHIGGVETHVMDISRELVRRGHEVTVATSRYAPLPRVEEIDGLSVHRSDVLLTLFRSPVTPGLSEDLARLPVDLYHAHSPSPVTFYFAARAKERTGTPLVVTYHCDLEIPPPAGPLVTGLYRRTLEAYAMRQADRLIATTRTYAATSRSLWHLDPAVIPNAVDAERFHPGVSGAAIRERHGLSPEDRVVLFVGRLVRHKGIEYVLQSLQRVDAHLLIAGEGEYAPQLRTLAGELGLQGRAVFAGRISEADKPAYFAACDLLVLPSVSRLEAFGIAALEAMASGKPVVVSNVPGVREVIVDGEEGRLVEPMDTRSLAYRLEELLSDPSERERMGRRGRETVERHFTIRSVVNDLEHVYDQAQSTTSRG